MRVDDAEILIAPDQVVSALRGSETNVRLSETVRGAAVVEPIASRQEVACRDIDIDAAQQIRIPSSLWQRGGIVGAKQAQL